MFTPLRSLGRRPLFYYACIFRRLLLVPLPRYGRRCLALALSSDDSLEGTEERREGALACLFVRVTL